MLVLAIKQEVGWFVELMGPGEPVSLETELPQQEAAAMWLFPPRERPGHPVSALLAKGALTESPLQVEVW